MTLQEQFDKPVLFHWVGWYGKDGFPTKTGYDSRDPNVITSQLTAMKVLGGPDSGVIALTYGLTSDFITQAVWAMANQTSALMMPFALCMDPWAVKQSPNKNQHMIDTLKTWPYTAILQMDNYLKDDTGKKMILDFATGVSQSAIQQAFPDVHYMLNGPDFDWVRIPPKPNKTQLPCTYFKFDDGTGKDRNVSVDDPSQPARIIYSNAGDAFWANDVTAGKYVQFVTWNDVTENTDCETFASMISIKI